MSVYNVEEYIGEAIDSIINQSFDFNKVQLIIIDDGSPDNSKEIVLDYQSQYPNNILVLSKENGGQASAFNFALDYVEGKYVNFMDPDDIISKDTLKVVNDFFNENTCVDLVSLPMFLFERMNGPHYLNSKFTNENRIVNLLDDIYYIQLSIVSSFIKKEALIGHTFNTTLLHGYDAVVVNEILIAKKQYGLIGLNENAHYMYRKRFSNDSTIDKSRENDKFFTHKIINYFKYLFDYSIEKEGYILDFIQALVLYDLFGIAKVQELPKEWGEYEIKEFWNYFSYILNLIDDEIIINHKFVPKLYKSFFIYFKRKDFHIITKKHKVFLKSGDYTINKLHNHRIYFDFVDFNEGFISFLGTFTSSCYPEAIRIEAIKKSKNKDKEIFVDYGNAINSVKRILSIDWQYVYHFDVKIPIDDYEEAKISFRVVYDNIESTELLDEFYDENNSVIMKNRIRFTYRAPLSDLSSYFIKNSRIVKFKGKTFYTFPYNFSSFIKNELFSMKKILFSGKKSSFNAFVFRFIYLICFVFMKNKRIWLFNDRPLYADDNGKYLFEYSINKDDGVKKYYVLDKDSKDFKNMKRISSNIIVHGSFKHKFLYMFAEKIITSHLFKPYINPFYDENLSFYSGIINSDLYFLQHGITMGNVSKSINKRYNNINLFLTSSNFERNSILNGDYNYDEDVVQLLGFPRYDYLNNKNNKKQILFAPTWRNFLWKKSLDIGEKLLLESEYFSRLNGLFNNKKLLTFLKEKGYNLVFKPHPELITYVDLFDCDDKNIIVSRDDSYQDLFNESSLLITDYSSVAFDFAYLKKPVIYYQYADEYNYEKGYFDFNKGFGELIEDEDVLVDKIIKYIENDCVMEDKYKQRVDTFFKFGDQIIVKEYMIGY